eukprot:3749952-Amphidinium_carterae.1
MHQIKTRDNMTKETGAMIERLCPATKVTSGTSRIVHITMWLMTNKLKTTNLRQVLRIPQEQVTLPGSRTGLMSWNCRLLLEANTETIPKSPKPRVRGQRYFTHGMQLRPLQRGRWRPFSPDGAVFKFH